MEDKRSPVDAHTLFAAFAIHKLLAGMEAPEEHFQQIEDSYSDVCQQAWKVAKRMMEVREPFLGEFTSSIDEQNEGG